jgi:hypothetical protein
MVVERFAPLENYRRVIIQTAPSPSSLDSRLLGAESA